MKLTPASNPPEHQNFVILHYFKSYIDGMTICTFTNDISRTIVGKFVEGAWYDDRCYPLEIAPSHWAEIPELEV